LLFAFNHERGICLWLYDTKLNKNIDK